MCNSDSSNSCVVGILLIQPGCKTMPDIFKYVKARRESWTHNIGHVVFNLPYLSSAKVQIDYRLRYAHSRTRAAHSKLPVDPCATRSL